MVASEGRAGASCASLWQVLDCQPLPVGWCLNHGADACVCGLVLSGVGAIGLSLLALAPGLRRLRCVEVNGSGASPFASSAAHLARTRPSSLQHSASGSPHTPAAAPELCYEVGAAGSRTAEFLSCADVVVVDPPRKVRIVLVLLASRLPFQLLNCIHFGGVLACFSLVLLPPSCLQILTTMNCRP